MSFSGAAERPENRERIAMIKLHVGVDDALVACDLVNEDGSVECPACGELDSLVETPAPGGGRYLVVRRKLSDASRCVACDETFDAIAVVRASKGLSLKAALDLLERECLSKTGRKR